MRIIHQQDIIINKGRYEEAEPLLLNKFAKKCRYLIRFPKIGRSYREIRHYTRFSVQTSDAGFSIMGR